jgi:hypothetical protein
MGRKPRSNSSISDEIGVECARLSRAFADILSAALSGILIHYAVRLAAVAITNRECRVAAIAALRQERDAAIDRLRMHVQQQRREALTRALSRRRRGRFRLSASRVRSFPRVPVRSPFISRRAQTFPIRGPC